VQFHCLACDIRFFCCAGARAQSDGETREEFWPEIDVFIKLNAEFRILLLGTVSRARENSSPFGEPPFDGQVGAHLDYIANKHVSFRIGYRYDTSLNGADPSKEHRLVTEQTFRKMLPARLLQSDRNRQDFRWINGDYSVRYRNRDPRARVHIQGASYNSLRIRRTVL
jgi:hypothetical protein